MNRNIFESFRCAFKGLLYVLKTQRNMRIHIYMATAVILAGVILGLTAIEVAILCCVISFVLIAEVVNTTLEVNLDFLNGKKMHPTVKTIKDILSGVVLIASVNAVIVGSVIFLPYVKFFKKDTPKAIEFEKKPSLQEKKLQGRSELCFFREKNNALTG